MKTFVTVGLLLMMIVLHGCSEPPVPPEVQQALDKEQDLWRSGAAVYAPQSYADFVAALKKGREQFIAERTRLAWFRDYQDVTVNYRAVLAQGEQVGLVIADTCAPAHIGRHPAPGQKAYPAQPHVRLWEEQVKAVA